MTVLYLTRPGSELRKQRGRLQVLLRGEVLATLPIREVERVVVMTVAQISAAAAISLLKINASVLYCSARGTYYGVLGRGSGQTERWLGHVARWQDMAYRVQMAKRILQIKIRNQRSLLRRQARNHKEPLMAAAAAQIGHLLPRLDETADLPRLMGVEGRASAIYFGAFGRCIRQDGVVFTGRNRRPPRDPVNALLSLGYMLVLGEVVAALMAEGLHTGLGMLHEPAGERPSLALDLLELYRQPIVDRLTLSLVNRAVLGSSDFDAQEQSGVRLTGEGLRRYLQYYEKAMTTPFHLGHNGSETSFRMLIRQQVEAFRADLEQRQEWCPQPLGL
ncbi:CRISPR-associated endonuclease Cas1 [Heliophilum fasciatum]|uniref:CRISPR-associated endonuclease Cas1 n=1 Tax=Heliophilum fasciatum TaxID=35700 RepID=A0A4R2RM87_9FIRM|nr:CRISPR-associated endonuclease Cas1 [Heliophilum fasciatum]MCW2279334.1 CRISPR-associated protein Cas1 [Heliophilum fasciatum]TCP60315.1 CRISPR-associated protein Cas1 [Heliophilum fasciatum]